MKVNGKVIVVTGGGNGVGRELVLKLLNKGAHVAAIDINLKGLEETKMLSNNNPHLSLHEVNITDKEAVENLVADVKEIHGTVDGLINNAGIIQPFITLEKMNFDQIERVMNVNFYGTLYMVKAFLPTLLERPQGHIVNVSSMGGFFPVPGQSVYGASKSAIKLMTEGLRIELSETNVGVSVVIPGGIATDIKKNSNLETKSTNNDSAQSKMLLTPSQAADSIIKAMEENKGIMYLGKDSNMMKIIYKLSPKLAAKLISKVMSKTH